MNNQIFKLLNTNLQRFADEFGDDNSEDSVVDYHEEDVEEVDSLDTDEEEEVVDPQQEDETNQTPQENAQYKKMRLKAEAEAYKKLEKERAELERIKTELAQQQAEKELRQNFFSQQKIWDKADEEGVSEDVAKKLLEAEFKETLQTERQKARERSEQLEGQRTQFKTDSFFNEVDAKTNEAIKQNPSLDYETAYRFFAFDYLRGSTQSEKKKAEKQTIANIQDGMKRRTVPTSSSGDSYGDISSLTEQGREMSNAFGVDPRDIAKYVRQAKKQK